MKLWLDLPTRRLRRRPPHRVGSWVSSGRLLFVLGVLDHSQDAWCDETGRADHSSGARQLADLDRRARAAYLDAASGAGGFDHVLTGGAAAGVHQNLDEISLCHTPSLFPIRIELMRYQRVAQPPPEAHNVEQLKEAAASCQACDLWREATQTVFGEGAEHARMMLSASSRATRRTCRVSRSSGQRVACWNAPWTRPRSTAAGSMSRMRSSIFGGRGEASGASTRSPTRARSGPAGPGWRLRSRPASRGSSSCLEPPPPSP